MRYQGAQNRFQGPPSNPQIVIEKKLNSILDTLRQQFSVERVSPSEFRFFDLQCHLDII